MRPQLLQLGNVVNLPAKLGANQRSKELQDNLYKASRVDDKELLEVLLVLPIKGAVGRPQPPERGLVLTAQSLVKVHQRIVVLHIKVKRPQEVSARSEKRTGL